MPDYPYEQANQETDSEPSVEFFVSSNSRDVMRRLADILRKQGYLGLADGSGRTKYYFDGSRNLYETVSEFHAIMAEQSYVPPTTLEREQEDKRKQEAEQAARGILNRIGMKMSLKGYLYLLKILQALLLSDGVALTPDKHIYGHLEVVYQTSRDSIDRAIHYALKQCGYHGANSILIPKLLVEAREIFVKEQESYGNMRGEGSGGESSGGESSGGEDPSNDDGE